MVIFYLILLLVITIYAALLVAFNSITTSVDLVFYTSPSMSIGFLIIITLVIGLLIGLLLAIQVFKVIPNRLELGRLRKDKTKLLEKMMHHEEQIKALASVNPNTNPISDNKQV